MDRTTLNIILGVFMVAGLAWGFSRYFVAKHKIKGKPYKGNKPAFVGQLSHRFPCVLIAPDKVVYASHVASGLRTIKLSFGSGTVEYIEDPRLKMFDNGTDTALVRLDAPTSVRPTNIAKKIVKGAKVFVFTMDESVETEVKRVHADGKFQVWFGAMPGDSSAAVINKQGELLGLITNQGGWGTNLTLIQDVL